MKYLLDTHTLLWWLDGDKQLSATARDIISDTENAIYVSAVSAWEIATKFAKGRLESVSGTLNRVRIPIYLNL
ncbi:type II toxin-antitoxin system VapC family toxin [uncultured Agrobacterium sp.]|uniref:type II toxin-antitoxin system VapC family toxin n=1 Tax=uncultured Agrobacterium sp. TaxID=157277 RepID=UPI002585AE7B|nr:type II toxin-antitoxin system VapC family toxin [uncultured Agrobacterium sp.]